MLSKTKKSSENCTCANDSDRRQFADLAVDADSPHHLSARPWLEQVLSETTPIGLAWIVVLAFLRITTHPRIMNNPLSPEKAIDYVESWLRQPQVILLAPGAKHWFILKNLLQAVGTAGNLTSDAHLAALALEQGCTIYSADNDFKRFPGIKHINPLT